jgi:hypothetical protein
LASHQVALATQQKKLNLVKTKNISAQLFVAAVHCWRYLYAPLDCKTLINEYLLTYLYEDPFDS